MRVDNWSFWRDGDRLRLRVTSDHPRWQFWRPRTVTCFFDVHEAIVLYQSLGKANRALMVQGDADFGLDDLEELADDIARALKALNPTLDAATEFVASPYAVAKLLIEKGYVKS